MKKGALLLTGSLFLSSLILTPVYSQEDMEVLDNSVFENPKRPAAIFSHLAHDESVGIEFCNECHHIYEDGELVEDGSSEEQRCSDCHGLEPEGDTPSLMKAFHTKCKTCHLDQKKGPVLCGECHIR